MSTTDWVIGKLRENKDLEIISRTAEDFLIVKSNSKNNSDYTFNVAVLGVKGVIALSDVEPLFIGATKPHLVVNVPTITLWSGAAIDRIHSEAAAFGTLGDISRAALTSDVGTFRDKNMGFFINGMKQHSNVSSVSYKYNKVFKIDRNVGESLVVAVIEAYNMSAEDVRNAKNQLGDFDVIVKSSSYGSITNQAEMAANSMGAQALTFAQLLGRLAK